MKFETYTKFDVGKVDDAYSPTRVFCKATDMGWLCTLKLNHKGTIHVGHNSRGGICKVWDTAEEIRRIKQELEI